MDLTNHRGSDMIIISQDNEPLRLLAHHTVVFPYLWGC